MAAKSEDEEFEPIGSLKPIASDKLQNLISCVCKSGCENNTCSCRKNQLKCMTFCSVCRGCDCSNSVEVENMNDDLDPRDDLNFDSDDTIDLIDVE